MSNYLDARQAKYKEYKEVRDFYMVATEILHDEFIGGTTPTDSAKRRMGEGRYDTEAFRGLWGFTKPLASTDLQFALRTNISRQNDTIRMVLGIMANLSKSKVPAIQVGDYTATLVDKSSYPVWAYDSRCASQMPTCSVRLGTISNTPSHKAKDKIAFHRQILQRVLAFNDEAMKLVSKSEQPPPGITVAVIGDGWTGTSYAHRPLKLLHLKHHAVGYRCNWCGNFIPGDPTLHHIMSSSNGCRGGMIESLKRSYSDQVTTDKLRQSGCTESQLSEIYAAVKDVAPFMFTDNYQISIPGWIDVAFNTWKTMSGSMDLGDYMRIVSGEKHAADQG